MSIVASVFGIWNQLYGVAAAYIHTIRKPFFGTHCLFSFSFPDVIGALAPTVAAALVDAVSALWQVEDSALTHKPFAIKQQRLKRDFCFSTPRLIQGLAVTMARKIRHIVAPNQFTLLFR
jgi:hypothetical protein